MTDYPVCAGLDGEWQISSTAHKPDDIIISNNGQFSTRANIVEYLGSDMIVYASLGSQEFSCKTSSKTDLSVGDEFKFDIQPSSIHLFDRKDDKRVNLWKYFTYLTEA